MWSPSKMATIYMLAVYQVTFNCVINFSHCSYVLCVLKVSVCFNLKQHCLHLKSILGVPQSPCPQSKLVVVIQVNQSLGFGLFEPVMCHSDLCTKQSMFSFVLGKGLDSVSFMNEIAQCLPLTASKFSVLQRQQPAAAVLGTSSRCDVLFSEQRN